MSTPTPAQLKAANMAPIPNAYAQVLENGDKVRAWNGKSFVTVTQAPFAQQLYAVPNSWEPDGPTPPPEPVPVPTAYTVTYAAPGASIPSLSLSAGATFVVHAAVAETGFTFESWGDGTHSYAPGSTYTMPAADVTLTAIYADSTGIPAIPTVDPAGYAIKFSHNFAGLSKLPSDWGAYSGEPGGDPDADWEANHIQFNSKYTSIITSGPGLLPDGATGYTSGGFGSNNAGMAAGRTDVCIRFPSNAAGMSFVALLWNDHATWPAGGEDDFVETGGASPITGFTVTSIYGGSGSNREQDQEPVKVPAGFDWTAFHVWSVIRQASAPQRTYLVDGVQTASITDSKLLLDVMNLDFQAQYLGSGTPTTPCPFDIAWAMEYQEAT